MPAPIAIPCPQVIDDCICTDDPVTNYSSEEPDAPVFFGTYDNPPTTGTYFAPGCLGQCESTVSQEAADECAREQALACSESSTPVAGNPVPRPNTLRFLTTSLDSLCIDAPMAQALLVTGGTAPYEFSLVSGSLPDGLVLDTDGTLSGTPTVAGAFEFVARVTDSASHSASQLLSLSVVSIATDATLPGATFNAPYSEQLSASGTTAPVAWVVSSGALPPGLSLSASGMLSGTPTDTGPISYLFTARLTDAAGADCAKQFTLTVNALLAYWTFDEYVLNAFILDSTPRNIDLPYATSDGVIEPGRVANCFRSNNAAGYEQFTGSTFNNANDTGFTVCGWARLAPADATGNGSIVSFTWHTPQSSLQLEFFNADLLLNANGDGVEFEQITYPFPQDGAWHFYRFWYDPSDNFVRLQLDMGATLASPLIPLASGSGDEVQFAGNAIFAGSTERSFDETGFWKRVLTNAEAAALYNGGAGITFGNPAMPQ